MDKKQHIVLSVTFLKLLKLKIVSFKYGHYQNYKKVLKVGSGRFFTRLKYIDTRYVGLSLYYPFL